MFAVLDTGPLLSLTVATSKILTGLDSTSPITKDSKSFIFLVDYLLKFRIFDYYFRNIHWV